jgi:hypothetical protein
MTGVLGSRWRERKAAASRLAAAADSSWWRRRASASSSNHSLAATTPLPRSITRTRQLRRSRRDTSTA